MSNQWREFVEDADGRGSSTRLCMVYGVFLGGVVVLWLTWKGTLGWEIFSAFLAASGGVYGLGKWRESAVEMQQIKSDSPNQPAEPPTPATVINVAGQDKLDAKDVNIKADGDVNVSPKRRRRK